MSENNNLNENEVHTETECECDCCCGKKAKKAKKEKKLTVHDVFLALFYAIIIAVGISLCIERGLNANITHLIAVTVSVIGAFVTKLLKYRKEIKAHITDIGFAGIMSVLGVFATVSALFF